MARTDEEKGTTVALPEWTQWFTVAGFAGLAGAVIQGWFNRGGLELTGKQQAERQSKDLDNQRSHQRLDLDGQLKRQRYEHDHQRAMLVQAAHFEVRKEMAEMAGNVAVWRSIQSLEMHGHEANLFPANPPSTPYAQPGEAIGDLYRIGAMHPTSGVRELAVSLANDIGGAYNEISRQDGRVRQPSLAKMLDWARRLGDLIELINEPPRPESNEPAQP